MGIPPWFQLTQPGQVYSQVKKLPSQRHSQLRLVSTIVIFAVVMIELPRTAAAHKANAHPEKDQKNDDERATGNAKSLLAAGHSVPKNLAQKPRRDEARADENHHERNRFQLGAF